MGGWLKTDIHIDVKAEVHVHSTDGGVGREILARLDAIQATQAKQTLMENEIMADLSGLEAQVKATTDAEDGVVLLLNDLSAKLAAAATDPQKVMDLSNSLKAGADKLAAAVVANTPAAPTT